MLTSARRLSDDNRTIEADGQMMEAVELGLARRIGVGFLIDGADRVHLRPNNNARVKRDSEGDNQRGTREAPP